MSKMGRYVLKLQEESYEKGCVGYRNESCMGYNMVRRAARLGEPRAYGVHYAGRVALCTYQWQLHTPDRPQPYRLRCSALMRGLGAGLARLRAGSGYASDGSLAVSFYEEGSQPT